MRWSERTAQQTAGIGGGSQLPGEITDEDIDKLFGE